MSSTTTTIVTNAGQSSTQKPGTKRLDSQKVRIIPGDIVYAEGLPQSLGHVMSSMERGDEQVVDVIWPARRIVERRTAGGLKTLRELVRVRDGKRAQTPTE
jgi:hypothetical protein